MHRPLPARRRAVSQAGFSLPEVAMAIGIIAVAFVALIGLIPTGLNQLRTAMDSNNEVRIVQSIMSKALATDYLRLNQLEGIIYYFDDEGSPVDTSQDPNTTEQARRLYAAKVFLEPGVVESISSDQMSFSTRLVIAYGNIFNTRAPELEKIDTIDRLNGMLLEKKAKPNVLVRSVTITKTDGK
jgi:uncharacterized protein (TIGR02598 family)